MTENSINIIPILFEKSLQHLLQKINFPMDYEDYEDEVFSEKCRNQKYECNIVIFAIISEIVSNGVQVDQYIKYAEYLGIRLSELSRMEEYENIKNVEFPIFVKQISERISLYQNDINKYLNNKTYSPPLSILYYFENVPGKYGPGNKFTETELNKITKDINDGNLTVNDLTFSLAIKDIYNNLRTFLGS